MRPYILAIILAIAAASAANAAGTDDMLSLGLASNIVAYDDQRMQELKLAELDVETFPAMIDSLKGRAAGETVEPDAAENLMMRFLLTVTDMSQTGIKLYPGDNNFSDDPMARAVFVEQADLTESAIRTERLPYIAAWMKENHKYLSQEMADSFLDNFRHMADIIKKGRDSQVSTDMLMNFPDFESAETAAIYSAYKEVYSSLMALRAQFFNLKYGAD